MSLFRTLGGALIGLGLALPGAASAQTTVHGGQVIAIFPDPSDFVVQLSVNGRCGSNFFHVLRANANFREMVATSLTAFSTSKTMSFFVTGCGGDRNIVSHGFVSR